MTGPNHETARRTVMVLAFLIGLGAVMPWAPDAITATGQDDPNTVLQHALFGLPFAYGRDIHFTHGPWAIWYFRHYWPTSYAPFIAAHLATTLALVWLAADTADRAFRTSALKLLALLAVLGVFAVDFDARLYLLIAAAALTFDERATGARAWTPALFAALAGASGLVKVSATVVGAAAIGALSLYEALALRRLPRTGIAYLGGLVAADLLAGQNPADLPGYFVSALDVASGYAEAIGYTKGALFPPAGALIYLIVALLFGLVALATEWRRRGPWGLVFALSLGLVLYGVFKSSFVIDNFMHLQHVATLLPLGLVYVAANREFVPGRALVERHARSAMLGAGALGLVVVLGIVVAGRRDPGLYDQKLAKLADNILVGLETLGGRRDTLEARHAAALSEIRARHPLPEAEGKTTLLTPLQSVGLAHGFELRPLPTINVYQAWTPRAIERTVRHFADADGPAHVFADRMSRLDRAYWLALIEHYRPVEVVAGAPGFVRFARAEPRAIERGPARRVETRFGDAVAVDAAQPLWAEARIRPTALGRLVELLFKKPEMVWRLELAGGREVEVRGGPILAQAGFLLSPAEATVDDLIGLPEALSSAPDRAVRRLSIVARRGSDWLYEPTIELALTPLGLPARR